MDSLGEQNLPMQAWSFVDSAPTEVYTSMGLCATECVLNDLHFISRSLKCRSLVPEVHDFSPFLWIQPNMGQHHCRLPIRHRADITAHDITGISDQPALLLESLLFPLHITVHRSVPFLSSTMLRVQQCPASPSLPPSLLICRCELAALWSQAGRSWLSHCALIRLL